MKYVKGEGNLSFQCVKGPKGLPDAFYGCEKAKITSWFIDLFTRIGQCI